MGDLLILVATTSTKVSHDLSKQQSRLKDLTQFPTHFYNELTHLPVWTSPSMSQFCAWTSVPQRTVCLASTFHLQSNPWFGEKIKKKKPQKKSGNPQFNEQFLLKHIQVFQVHSNNLPHPSWSSPSSPV